MVLSITTVAQYLCVLWVVCSIDYSPSHYEITTSRPVMLSPLICLHASINHTFALFITPSVNHPLLLLLHSTITMPPFSKTILHCLWVSFLLCLDFFCQPTSNQRKCCVSDYVRGSQGWLARSSKQAQRYTLTNVIFRKAESGKRSSRPDVKFWLAIMALLPQKLHHLRCNSDTKFNFALSAQQVRVPVVTLERVIND